MQRPRLILKPSMLLMCLLGFMYLGSISIIFLIEVGFWIKLLLFAMASSYVWHAIFHHALRTSGNAIAQCWLDEAGIWHLQAKNGRLYKGILRPDSLITPYLSVLSFKVKQRYLPLAITITPDALDKEAFRRLRIYLRTIYDETA